MKLHSDVWPDKIDDLTHEAKSLIMTIDDFIGYLGTSLMDDMESQKFVDVYMCDLRSG